MSRIRNFAICLTAVMVCMIAAVLAAMLTLIMNAIAFLVAPIVIAAYAADYAWTGDDKRSARWEKALLRTQTIFALPATAVIAIASIINDTLRSKIR